MSIVWSSAPTCRIPPRPVSPPYVVPGNTPSTIFTYAQLAVGFDPNAACTSRRLWEVAHLRGWLVTAAWCSRTLKLALLDSLHLSVGARDSAYGYDIQTNLYNSSGSSSTGALAAVSKSLYQKSGTITPYAGLVWDLNKEWSLYGSYTDIFKVQANVDRNGSLLPPITGSNYEFGTKAELLNNKLKYSLAFYKSERYNVAVADANAPIVGLISSAFVATGKSTAASRYRYTEIDRRWRRRAGRSRPASSQRQPYRFRRHRVQPERRADSDDLPAPHFLKSVVHPSASRPVRQVMVGAA